MPDSARVFVPLLGQRGQQCLGLLHIKRVEAFSKPAINRGEQFVSLLWLLLVTPETRHAHRRAQFQGLRLLLTRNHDRTLKVRFRFRCV